MRATELIASAAAAAQARPADFVIADARRRFRYLSADGLTPRPVKGGPVPKEIAPGDIAVALQFLAHCRHSKKPGVHTADIQVAVWRRFSREISIGAVIAAALALSFDVQSTFGCRGFHPHALISVRRYDVRESLAVRRQKQFARARR